MAGRKPCRCFSHSILSIVNLLANQREYDILVSRWSKWFLLVIRAIFCSAAPDSRNSAPTAASSLSVRRLRRSGGSMRNTWRSSRGRHRPPRRSCRYAGRSRPAAAPGAGQLKQVLCSMCITSSVFKGEHRSNEYSKTNDSKGVNSISSWKQHSPARAGTLYDSRLHGHTRFEW